MPAILACRRAPPQHLPTRPTLSPIRLLRPLDRPLQVRRRPGQRIGSRPPAGDRRAYWTTPTRIGPTRRRRVPAVNSRVAA